MSSTPAPAATPTLTEQVEARNKKLNIAVVKRILVWILLKIVLLVLTVLGITWLQKKFASPDDEQESTDTDETPVSE